MIDFLGYREWAMRVYLLLAEHVLGPGGHAHFHNRIEDLDACETGWPIFAVGWSDIIPKAYYTTRSIFVVHPSPLPLYAGGSPIQHQIMAGETVSAVTIFKLDPAYPGIDSGPIAWSRRYSLEGDLGDILERIAEVTARGIEHLMNDAERVGWQALPLQPQAAPPVLYRRRTPAESEITPDMLAGWTALQLHNFVRALQDPYPNAFIRTFDGGRLYITKTRAETPPVLEQGPSA